MSGTVSDFTVTVRAMGSTDAQYRAAKAVREQGLRVRTVKSVRCNRDLANPSVEWAEWTVVLAVRGNEG